MNNPRENSGAKALAQFWRRTPFHDMVIKQISAVNQRVIFRLEEFILIVTGVTDATGLAQCELPATWLSERLEEKSGRYLLNVETEGGPLSIKGVDFRLIRISDLAMLIPPIDT